MQGICPSRFVHNAGISPSSLKHNAGISPSKLEHYAGIFPIRLKLNANMLLEHSTEQRSSHLRDFSYQVRTQYKEFLLSGENKMNVFILAG